MKSTEPTSLKGNYNAILVDQTIDLDILKITFLGTGTSQGIPTVGCNCDVCLSDNYKDQRLRSSALVTKGDTSLLIDTGPDLRQQMLVNRIIDIDAIVFTHEHNDHVIGLDDIRPLYFRRRANIPTYGLHRVHQEIKTRFSYMFGDSVYPGVAQIDTHDIDSDTHTFNIDNIPVTPIGVMHGNLPILGYRFGNMAYITDASYISEDQIKKLLNLDIIVVNALQRKEHHSHFTLEEALEFVNKIGAKKAYFTHLSHLMGKHDDISLELPDHIHLAYDGLVVNL